MQLKHTAFYIQSHCKARYIPMLVAILFLFSCGGGTTKNNEKNTVQILYDIPEAVFAINLYISQYPNKNIIPIQLSNNTQLSNADVLILKQSTIDNTPFTLNTITEKYTAESTIKQTAENMHLISFSIPLLIVKKSSLTTPPSEARISLSTLQTLTKQHTIVSTKTLPTFGFVPEMTDIFKQLFQSQEAYNNWIEQSFEDYQEYISLYRKHFTPVSYIAQLQHDNIIYKLVTSNFFFNLPLDIQDTFYYFLFTLHNGQIQTVSNSYIGIGKNSQHKNDAKFFINWLFQTTTQKKLLETQKEFFPNKKHQRLLGNTFSTNWDMNIQIFSEHSWLWNNQPLLQQLQF